MGRRRINMTHKPSYRFKGYEESWEEKKFINYLTESRVKGSSGDIAKKLTVKLWRKGIVPKLELYSGSSATQYYIRSKGQFMYGKLDFLNQAFGIIPEELDGYESTLDSPAFDISESLNSSFLLEYVSRKEFYEYQGIIANGSRKAKRIHVDTFLEMPINLPSLPEQTAIGSFFQELDQLISLQQRKLEVLKEQKKTYLKLLFPAKGQTKPALRFAGFEDEWKEVKLREIGEIQTGNTPPTNEEDNYEKNGFPWVTPTDINSLVLHTTSKQLSEVGKSKARIAKSGSILVTCIASIGKNTLVRTDSAFNQQINSLTPSEKYSSYFLLTQSEIWSRYMLSVAGAGTMQIINKSDFSNIKAMVPSLPEQKVIGSFFQDLDKAIDKQEEKVNQLKESKQTLLRKMFI